MALGSTPNLGIPGLCRFRKLSDGTFIDAYMGMQDVPLGDLRSNAPIRTQILTTLDRVITGQETSAKFFYLAPTDPFKPALFPEKIVFRAEGTEVVELSGRKIAGRVFTLSRLVPPAELALSSDRNTTVRTVGNEYRYVLHPECGVALLRQTRRIPADRSTIAPWAGGERVLAADPLCPKSTDSRQPSQR